MSNPYEAAGWCDGFRPGGTELTARLVELSGLSPGASVLDIGCGTGEACDWLRGRGYSACGVDSSALLVAQGRLLYPEIPLFIGDVAAPPFPTGCFDALLLECVLSVLDAPAVLAAGVGLLRPGGLLLLSDVYARGNSLHGSPPIFRTRPELEQLFSTAGFCVMGFEDRSRELGEFWAKKLLEGAGFEALFGRSFTGVRQARAGYCLLWACLEEKQR